MFKWLKKSRKKGFTLIELIVVIAILAILAAIAIPRYNASREKSAITAHNSNVRILEGAAANYLANEGAVGAKWETGTEEGGGIDKYVDKPAGLTVPKGVKEGDVDHSGKNYVVEISQTGVVTISPGMIAVE